MPVHPSGEQYEISLGDQKAVVVEVGGGVRAYSVGGRDVLQPYDLDQMCDGAHGQPLIPWPNRLGGGTYSWDGQDYQVALTEPEKDNAIHGFLRWRNWRCLEHEASRVVMGTLLHPLKGYPFALDVAVAYELTDDGLTVTTTAWNVGSQDLPYADGQHPYLSPGGEGSTVDDCTLTLDASTRIDTDPKRQLPTGRVPVEGTEYDFRGGRSLSGLECDFAFTDLARDSEGKAWLRLRGADGRTVAAWVDQAYPYLEVYTADTLAPDRRRRGLGCEPMTAPPNALQSGDDVIRLQPGARVTSTWGVHLE